MKIKALALDVHGTLADEPVTRGPDRSPIAVQALLEAHGVSVSYQAWEAAWGMAFFIDYPRRGAEDWRQFLAYAFERLGEPLPPAAREAVIGLFAAQPASPPSPDGLRALQAARVRGLKSAAFTTIPRFRMASLLADVGDLLDLYFDGYEARDAKGSRRYYERLAERIGVAPGEVLCVGDEPFADVEMPRRVGMSALLLDRSRRLSGEGMIHSLDEVAAWLDHLAAIWKRSRKRERAKATKGKREGTDPS
jgi:FMN phosphatase YigB (HAD superfamily)